MAIFIHNNKDYIAASIYHLRDTSLTLQAMGLLSFMLSCSDNFKFSIEGLTRISACGDTATRSALKELREKKYVVVEPRKENGKIVEWNYHIYEKPQIENPDVEIQHVENQGQSIISNINITNNIKEKNISSKDIYDAVASKPRKHFSPPSVDDVKAYCLEKGYSMDAQHFVDFYESKGWVVGKSPMKDWKAAVRTWIRNDKVYQPSSNTKNANRNSKFTDPGDVAAAVFKGIQAGMARAGQ